MALKFPILIAPLLAVSFGPALAQSADPIRIGIMARIETIGPDLRPKRADFRGTKGSGAVKLVFGDKILAFDKAHFAYLSQSGYVEHLQLLDDLGRYDLQAALEQWAAYTDLFRSLPDWRSKHSILTDTSKFLGPRVEALLSIEGLSPGYNTFANAQILLSTMAPGRTLDGSRLSLLEGRYRMNLNGRDFFVDRLCCAIRIEAARIPFPAIFSACERSRACRVR